MNHIEKKLESQKKLEAQTNEIAPTPDRAAELAKIVHDWLKTPSGRDFHQTDFSWMVLLESLEYDLPVTSEKLTRHLNKLLLVYPYFSRVEAAAVQKKAIADAEEQSRQKKLREQRDAYNSPEQIKLRADAKAAADAAAEKAYLASLWKPAFPAEDSHSILIRATRETENYMRRKHGFPERS